MIHIRTFIGIDFSDECKRYISDLQQRLKKYAVRGRWKYTGNFHLTLKFLDEINAEQKKQIDRSMADICGVFRPFSLEISKAGIFKGNDRIRVLWLGVGGDLDALHQLAGGIDSSMSELGFPPEKRRYTPHITIGQDIIFECPFENIAESIGEISYGPIEVRKIYLFKSEQIQNRRVYTVISEYDLKGV
ncbi:MAG TPA: RNA 2',3'-cyclic phosphodiesterase [Clostridiales bacterium]|nr:RNA 2',3'-cyclic phosphodiesterase [Clostridiales bacterium]HPV00876.1 RNA 2',3'-cyclic phosphodiesterase [Clostridiales bacterium]